MDNEEYLIAVASSDGIVVNNHFGRAKRFYIYKVNEYDEINLIEKREVSPVCDGGNHYDNKLNSNLEKISDCKYLLVSRIGDGARNMAENFGIESYEIPGIINDSIEQLIKYVKVNSLFL